MKLYWVDWFLCDSEMSNVDMWRKSRGNKFHFFFASEWDNVYIHLFVGIYIEFDKMVEYLQTNRVYGTDDSEISTQ